MANKVIESPKYLSLVNKQISYISKYDLAQSRFSTYNGKEFNLGINLTYKYTITNMGKNLWNKFINKRDLVKVDLFSV